MAQQNLERRLAAGIQAAQQGDAERARELLEGVLRQDRNNELAWVWMASVVGSTRERRICLEKVLQLNPQNEAARSALNNLVGVIGDSSQIDYASIAAAAQTRAPAASPAEGSPSRPAAPTAGLSRNQLRVYLGVAAIVLSILLILSLLLPGGGGDAAETATPLPPTTAVAVAEATAEVTDEAAPSPTEALVQNVSPSPTRLAGLRVTRDPSLLATLPTNTPTATWTATITQTPSPTLPPVENYTVLFLASENTVATNLYELTLGGEPRVLARNLLDIDYDGGTLAFVEPTGASVPTPDAEATEEVALTEPITQVHFAPLDDLGNDLQLSRIPLGRASRPTVSPDGSQVIYVSDEDGDQELYLIETSTGITRQLTSNETNDTDPHWSPDGTRVVYVSEGNGRKRIAMLSLVEGTDEIVLETRGDNITPRFSPDGQQIVYVNQLENQSNIMIAGADGLRVRQLTPGLSTNLSPDWTPDGRYVVFLSNRDIGGFQLYIMTPDGGNVQSFPQEGLNLAEVLVKDD